jgi:protein O-mannosyl-transferase
VAGCLFAVHPVHVEAVAGVVGRAELLAAAATLAALLLHRQELAPGAGRSRTVILAPVCAFAAMMSKESAFVVPVLAWLFERAAPPATVDPGRRRTLWLGHGAALAAALALRCLVVGGIGPPGPIPLVDNPAASAGPVAGRLTALACVTRYAGLLLWPARLSADYSYDQIPIVTSPWDARAIGGALLVLSVLVGGIALRRRLPAAAFSLLFVAVSLAPVANLIVFVGTLLAERLLYLPSAGLCLLVGTLASRPVAPAGGRAALAAAAILVFAGAARTTGRLPDWRDDFALYTSAAEVSPRSARIRYNLGNAWLRQRRDAQAEAEYRRALAIYPAFADAQANLGMALLQQGRATEALDALSLAAERLPRNAEVAVNQGTAHRMLGQAGAAEADFRRALLIDPATATAWNNLGSLLLGRGETGDAIEALGHAVASAPEDAIYHVNLGDALRAAGRDSDALVEFDRAARLDPGPGEARRAAGEAALMRGDRSTAAREFQRALEAEPPSARAANFLGFLAAGSGDRHAAAGYYERALALDPTLADAHRSLGLVLAGIPEERRRAAEHLRRCLELEPNQAGAEDLKRMLAGLEK